MKPDLAAVAEFNTEFVRSTTVLTLVRALGASVQVIVVRVAKPATTEVAKTIPKLKLNLADVAPPRAEHVRSTTVRILVRILGELAQVVLVPVTRPVTTIHATIIPKLNRQLVTTAELRREHVRSATVLTLVRVHGELAQPVNVRAVKLAAAEVA